MSNALYRKFRPSNWSQVIGQDLIVRTLSNEIKHDRLSHAYLFCGTRGTGKTTTAKLFAKTINCENQTIVNDAVEPCNECDSCVSINKNSNLNVVEIDAASNNGVDNVRDIIEEVKYATSEKSYKVYIIDEVHMLSIGAFNALLKTLEEPPSHVIFILATTDQQKIPATILSRVQRFNFLRLGEDDIISTLKEYSSIENIQIDDEAIEYIATRADGGMRDALSLLDQCNAYFFDEVITYDKVITVLGGSDVLVLLDILSALIEFDSQKIVSLTNKVTSQSKDITQITNDLIMFLRDLMLVKIDKSMVNMSKSRLQDFEAIASTIETEVIMYYIESFTKLLTDIKYSENKKVLFELCCLKLCNPKVLGEDSEVLLRLNSLESTVEEIKENGFSPTPKKTVSTLTQDNVDSVDEEQEEDTKEIDYKVDKNATHYKNVMFIKKSFEMFKKCVDNSLSRSMLSLATLVAKDDSIYILCDTSMSMQVLKNTKDDIQKGINKFLETDVDIIIMLKNEFFRTSNTNNEKVVVNDIDLSEVIDFPITEV